MAVEATSQVQVSEPATRRGKLPVIRLLLAVLLTVVLLPYAWGFTLITTMMFNYTRLPNLAYVAQLLVGLAAVIALNYHLSARFSRRATVRIAVGVLACWLAVNAAIVFAASGPNMPLAYALAGYLPGTLWLLWLGWMFYPRLNWGVRLGVLAALLAGVGVFVSMFKIQDLTGANGVNFVFTWNAPQAAFTKLSDTAPVDAQEQASPVVIEPGPHDSPQYLGPQRSAVLTGVQLVPDWSAHPPREVWRKPVGAGWSSFATLGDLAITQEQRGGSESVVCYDIRDGRIVWMHGDPVIFDNTLGGPGPRATPTIHEGRVYSVGATGILNCLELADGKRHWSVDILNDNDPGSDNVMHGVCASPLIVDDTVVVCPSGANNVSLAAYDRETGARRWQAGRERASYASPMLAEIGGVRQILTMTSEGIVGHDPENGTILWSFPWTNDSGVNCSQPIPAAGGAGRVFISTGYNTGSALLEVTQGGGGGAGGVWSAEEIWTARRMKTKFTSPVLHDGHVYGLDDGILQCIELGTGKQKWKKGRYGHGQILLVEELLIVQTEPGPVVLVQPDPDELRELGSVAALADKTWNPPVLADKFLLVRNDREAVCYEVATIDDAPADEVAVRDPDEAAGTQP